MLSRHCKEMGFSAKVIFLDLHLIIKQAKIVSEIDQEIPQSQTPDNPMAPGGRANPPSRDTRKTN